MLGGPESLLKLPPRNRLSGIADRTNMFVSAIASSTTNYPCLTDANSIIITGCYITWIADTDCYINWYDGRAGSGDTSSAASGTSMFLPAGVMVDFWHRPQDNSFSVIQKTASGFIDRWLSNP
jgi:hypothetical protein